MSCSSDVYIRGSGIVPFVFGSGDQIRSPNVVGFICFWMSIRRVPFFYEIDSEVMKLIQCEL